jgi:hypothetical protein
MMAFGATGRYGMTSAIALRCWEWSIHEWKRFFRFSWKQPTTSDWLYLTGRGRVFTVLKAKSSESAVLAATSPVTPLISTLKAPKDSRRRCGPGDRSRALHV